MTIEEMNLLLCQPEYDFLIDRPELGDNIILLGVGGSHAYGTNVDGSDLDIRGVAVNTKRNVLTNNLFEQSVDTATDTTVYAFDKLLSLLCNCNPNIIEMLGLKPEHYLYLNQAGRTLLKSREIFLSKRAAYSFGGYANSQLRRLENKSAKTASQEKEEQFILRSIECAQVDYKRKYFPTSDGDIRLFIDAAVNEGYASEIFADINLKHYPLRDFKDMVSEMQSIIKSYNTIGRRNENALTHGKIAKHMMHLVRLYLMCHDILADGKIVTYREKDHDLLMSIRNGAFLDDNNQPLPSFYELVNDLEADLEYWKAHTALPDSPDMNAVNALHYQINSQVCEGAGVCSFGDIPFKYWRTPEETM